MGPKSGGSSDTSPPTMQSFAEESSPENLNPNNRLVNGQSTESLDSLSDESGGAHPQNNQKASRNPVPHPRKVCKQTADFTQFYSILLNFTQLNSILLNFTQFYFHF